jgi:hypothetical protein
MTPRKSQRARKPVTIWEEKKAPSPASDPKITKKQLEIGQKLRCDLSQLGLFLRPLNLTKITSLTSLSINHRSNYVINLLNQALQVYPSFKRSKSYFRRL